LKKPKTAAQKEAKRNNKLAIDTILDGLTDSVKSKVGSCASTKEIWDKLQDLYAREEAVEEEEVEEYYNISDFKEENRGQFFCFNCEGVGHVEFECPHPRIERDDNEEEENHKVEMIQQEDENLKKLKHVEIENSKLKDTRRKLRSELVSCEKTVVILKKQLEDFEKLREETISLKTLLEEERRIGKVRNVQMKKKEEDCEKLEQEVVSMRKSLRNSQVQKGLTHFDAWVKLHTKKMQIPTRRLKKELHRQLMRSRPGYQKEGMITKEMNIQEDLLPSGIKEASINMKETKKE
jgi:hypothetical protein